MRQSCMHLFPCKAFAYRHNATTSSLLFLLQQGVGVGSSLLFATELVHRHKARETFPIKTRLDGNGDVN